MITILLAAYNGESYLREQLDSILSQTYKDLSILISDDCSTDNTGKIIKEYEEQYSGKIRSLPNEKGSGSPQNNFFRLVKEADDDYIMFCDQDDIWIPKKVEMTLKEMKGMEEQWGSDMPILVHGDVSVTDGDGNMIQKSMAKFQKIAVCDNRFAHYLVENNITGSTIMINRRFLSYFTYIPENCMMHDWWMGLLASCFGRISYIRAPLVLYRQHGNNQVGSKGAVEQYVKRLTNKERVRKEYGKMFSQGRSFLKGYGDQMDQEKKEALEQFISLEHKNRLQKIRTIWKYKLYKSTIIRTLGQMVSI